MNSGIALWLRLLNLAYDSSLHVLLLSFDGMQLFMHAETSKKAQLLVKVS